MCYGSIDEDGPSAPVAKVKRIVKKVVAKVKTAAKKVVKRSASKA